MKRSAARLGLTIAVAGVAGTAAAPAPGSEHHRADRMRVEGFGPGAGPDAMAGLLMVPAADAERGRERFVAKRCVICHAVNGVGGEYARALDAAAMPRPLNPFDFAAGMWRHAEAMLSMQHDELREQITLTGQELADIVAFAYSPEEQARFSSAEIPLEIKALIRYRPRGDDGQVREEEG